MKNREKKLLYVILFILVLWTSLSWIIEPAKEKLSSLNQELDQKNLKLAQYEKTLSEKQSLLKEYNQISETNNDSGKDQNIVAHLLSSIESQAREQNIQISDMKPLHQRKSDDVQKIQISIELRATLTNLAQFVFQLENNLPLYIVHLKINSGQTSDGILKIHLLVSKISI